MDYAIVKIKKEILEAVKQAVGIDIDVNQLEITRPPEPNMGDFAVPCFYLTKLLRVSPNQIAGELKDKIRPHGVIKAVQNLGPYLNFFVDQKVLAQKVIGEIEKRGAKYGSLKAESAKVMLEYSSPNTHKEFHIGHLRNNVLGISLVNLLRFSGQKVISANYIGDIGSHVAKCLWAYDKFHKNDQLPENKGKYLGAIYTEAVQKITDNEKFAQEAAEVQRKLETGDKYFTKLWKQTRQWSLDELNDIYEVIGAKFDKVFYESEVEKPGKKIVQELLEQGIAKKSEGAVIIDLEKYDLKQFLLLKSDGSSLYSTKELALAKLKFEKYKVDESYVVVDSRQSFYFRQFFKTLEVMGFKKKLAHIAYEFLTLKDGAMASRKGNVVVFEDFLAEMEKLAQAETSQRHKDWSEADIKAVSHLVALAAIKFVMIKSGRNNVIVFDPQEALSFDGFTGPYLQYTLARINSILRKESAKNISALDFSQLVEPKEKELLLAMADFSEAVDNSTKSFEPSYLAKYLFDLCKSFASYYQEVPILQAETKTKEARLALISSIKQILENGLNLLGIEAPEKM